MNKVLIGLLFVAQMGCANQPEIAPEPSISVATRELTGGGALSPDFAVVAGRGQRCAGPWRFTRVTPGECPQADTPTVFSLCHARATGHFDDQIDNVNVVGWNEVCVGTPGEEICSLVEVYGTWSEAVENCKTLAAESAEQLQHKTPVESLKVSSECFNEPWGTCLMKIDYLYCKDCYTREAPEETAPGLTREEAEAASAGADSLARDFTCSRFEQAVD